MASIPQILRLVLWEALLPKDLTERVPEQSVMNSAASVLGFHAAGEAYLRPVYHFNARSISNLAGRNSHVLDLGSGSGQFLAYLSRYRPDLLITGIELSEAMLEVGRRNLSKSGLSGRVTLLCGDMRDLGPFCSKPIDVVSSVFALHHLEAPSDLAACLQEVSKFVANGAALWLFDHVRPRRRQTARDFPKVFTPDAEGAFCQDSSNSLKAAWSYDELSSALRASGLTGMNSAIARLIPFYQIHWAVGARPGQKTGAVGGKEKDLSPGARSAARQFARLFPCAP